MRLIECIQGSPEWHQARLGILTASRADDAFAKTKSGWGASRDHYMTELLLERLTGTPAPHYVNAAMQWGSDHEQDAVAAYEFEFNRDTQRVGFCMHNKLNLGASPDRVIMQGGQGEIVGLLEVKCPESKTHLKYWLDQKVPADYRKQMDFQMWITGARWVDFVSFDPRFVDKDGNPLHDMQLVVRRLERDEKMIQEISDNAQLFANELDSLEALVRKRRDMKEAA